MQVIFNDNGVAAGDPDFLFDKSSNHMALGATAVNPDAALEIKSSTGALILPRLTTAQRDALNPVSGMVIFNTETNTFQGYAGENTNAVISTSEVSATTREILNDGGLIRHVAQTFTPSSNAELLAIEFNVGSLSSTMDLTVELYEGNDPGSGFYFNEQDVSISQLGWVSVPFPPGYMLQSNIVYHFIVKAKGITSEMSGLFSSDVLPAGEHPGGALFVFSSLSGIYSLLPFDDLDFRVRAKTNGVGWVDLH
jgi:hypothetical protein